jgi:polar amino acid transport system substrate-binding protein
MILSHIRAALLALLVLAAPALAQAPGAAPVPAPALPEAVQVPNFWDPRARLERPEAGEIGAIRFLVSDDFPPFAFRDRRGMLVGFDVDLAEALCRVLKVPCAMQARPFDMLKAGLADGTGNAIMAGLDPEKAGAEGLIATQAYLKIPGRFVAAKGASFSPEAAGGAVAVACGSAHAAFLARYFPALQATCTNNTAAALAQLKAGKVAAVFGDALGLAFWLHGPDSQDCCRFAGGAYLDDAFFGAGLSIVLKPEDRKLRSALDYALREVYRAGTYEELYLRYFPVSLF